MDLFAGTGSVGIEALSRGAAHVLFVEDDPAARTSLEANLAACCVDSREATVWMGRGVAGLIRHLKTHVDETADLFFADPPIAATKRSVSSGRLLRGSVSHRGIWWSNTRTEPNFLRRDAGRARPNVPLR
jgi:16S rRNA (guanine966-N2)-methyltransferase